MKKNRIVMLTGALLCAALAVNVEIIAPAIFDYSDGTELNTTGADGGWFSDWKAMPI